jgi:hypothetical protein
MSKNSPFKFNPLGLISGGLNIYQGIKGSKARKEEQRQANLELAKRKADFEGTDLSNPYANMENAYEDLTVNQQQAQFEAQQGQQQRANIMQNMQGAAGGSGVAGLAQAMANQGQQQTARASASIGQQESANQRMAAQGAMNLQSMERQGKKLAQDRRLDMNESLLGMSQQRKIASDDARQRARDSIMKGIGQTFSAFQMKGAKGGVGGSSFKMKDPTFFKKSIKKY